MNTYEDVRLGDLGHVLTVTRGFPTQRAVPEGDLRVMSVAALRNASEPKYFANFDEIETTGVGPAQPGDVLVAIEGGTVGEALVVPDSVDQFVPSQQAATLRVIDTNTLDPWYLGAWLSTETAREQVRRLARGLGIQRIPIKELASVTVRIAALREQRLVGERFRAFESSIQSHRAVTACLEQLRDVDLTVTFAADDPHEQVGRRTNTVLKKVPKKIDPEKQARTAAARRRG